MTDDIRIQYDDLEQIGRRFRELNDNAERWLRWTNFCLRRMDDGVWIGKGAQEYRDELEYTMIPALRRLNAVLGDTVWLIAKTGNLMREAEQAGASLFNADGTRLVVDFGSLGFFNGGSFGGEFGGWTAGEIERLGNWFGVTPRRPGIPVDDLEQVNQIDNDMLDKRFGRKFFAEARDIINGKNQPNPDVPLTLPGQNGDVVTPKWFTEFSQEDGGLNGAADSSVLVAGAGDHNRLTGDIAKTSQALGGAQVSGLFAVSDPGEPVRGPGALAGQSPVLALSPAASAMADWIRAHPSGLFVLPPWSAAYGVEALNALEAEGFDLSQLNVVTFGNTKYDIPDGVNHRAVGSFPDIRVNA